MVFGGFEVVAGVGSSASVGGVAFDDGAVYFVHEVLDEGGGEVVVVAGFSGGEFYGYASSCRASECFVYLDEVFRGYFFVHVDFGQGWGAGLRGLLCVCADSGCEQGYRAEECAEVCGRCHRVFMFL